MFYSFFLVIKEFPKLYVPFWLHMTYLDHKMSSKCPIIVLGFDYALHPPFVYGLHPPVM